MLLNGIVYKQLQIYSYIHTHVYMYTYICIHTYIASMYMYVRTFVQKWKKGWVVVTTKELLKCKLEFYKDEDYWLTPSKSTQKITICELLTDIVAVEHARSSYKSHVMSIMFNNFDILIGFKSRTTMESWITKLNNIRGK